MTEILRERAERELVEDLRMRVVCQRGPVLGDRVSYQLQHLTGGVVTAVRPVERSIYTMWTEAVRGRVALLENYLRETGK